ncbi:hypothetical protein [Ensifer sp. LC163]|uniref:hypothetical protein n=1 Tax=Ensifer sp. LC163 TaxID=1120652 RepID=UPI0039B79560
MSAIARSAGIHPSRLFRWRKEFCQIAAPSVPQLIPAGVSMRAPSTSVPPPGVPPIGPAFANTVYKALGKRIRVMPFARSINA